MIDPNQPNKQFFIYFLLQLDKKVLHKWSLNDPKYNNASLIPHFCEYDKISLETNPELALQHNLTEGETMKVGIPDSCHFLFADTGMTDVQVGVIILLIALFILCVSLVLIVKLLNSLLKGMLITITLNYWQQKKFLTKNFFFYLKF